MIVDSLRQQSEHVSPKHADHNYKYLPGHKQQLSVAQGP